MSEDERSYFRIRAEQEIRAAQSARHPDAARAHYLMAGYYLDLVHNPEAAGPARPPLRAGSARSGSADGVRRAGEVRNPAGPRVTPAEARP